MSHVSVIRSMAMSRVASFWKVFSVHFLPFLFAILFLLASSDGKTVKFLDFLLETLWSLLLERFLSECDLTSLFLTPR